MSLSEDQLVDMMGANATVLQKSNKNDLLQFITFLRGRVEELESYKIIRERVKILEKSIVSHMQYNRRESIEIHGVPETISDDNLEKRCLDILEDIGCGKVKSSGVHACHRLKNRSKVVMRFTNRKRADSALHNKMKLKDIDRAKYGLDNNTSLFINESLCPPMQFLAYKVRQAKRGNKIVSYNLWKGKLSLKLVKDGPDTKIQHIQDLIDIGLATEEDSCLFIV